jgi:allophanate hydrolase subunit 2
LPGPQKDWFTDELMGNEFELSPASNRMGLRFKGKPLNRKPGELVSEAVSPGAMQVTNDGQVIVLGVDGQTIGGYPKVGHVIRADLDRLAQIRPGEKVCFVYVSQEEAEAAAGSRTAFLVLWRRRLEAADRTPQFVARS